MALQPVSYSVGARDFTGWLADGSRGGSAPAVLVAHEAGGLGDHTRERAAMLAELGYVAFATDLFGETDLDLERARVHSLGLRNDVPELRARMRASLALLERHPHVDAARLAAVV